MAEFRPLANPAPLGLGGFALTTFVLNVHNAGILADVGTALPLGLFYGGLAQLIAGILEFGTGNTFGLCAFGSYGAFWIALATLIYFKDNKVLPAFKDFHGAIMWTLIAWTIFTFIMTLATFPKAKALVVIFISLLILFILLDIHVITGSKAIGTIAGWEGIWTAFTAWYLMAAELINPAYGKEILPIGAPKQ